MGLAGKSGRECRWAPPVPTVPRKTENVASLSLAMTGWKKSRTDWPRNLAPLSLPSGCAWAEHYGVDLDGVEPVAIPRPTWVP